MMNHVSPKKRPTRHEQPTEDIANSPIAATNTLPRQFSLSIAESFPFLGQCELRDIRNRDKRGGAPLRRTTRNCTAGAIAMPAGWPARAFPTGFSKAPYSKDFGPSLQAFFQASAGRPKGAMLPFVNGYAAILMVPLP
jgi:hypothetical protein